jgi:hypothetical protein
MCSLTFVIASASDGAAAVSELELTREIEGSSANLPSQLNQQTDSPDPKASGQLSARHSQIVGEEGEKTSTSSANETHLRKSERKVVIDVVTAHASCSDTVSASSTLPTFDTRANKPNAKAFRAQAPRQQQPRTLANDSILSSFGQLPPLGPRNSQRRAMAGSSTTPSPVRKSARKRKLVHRFASDGAEFMCNPQVWYLRELWLISSNRNITIVFLRVRVARHLTRQMRTLRRKFACSLERLMVSRTRDRVLIRCTYQVLSSCIYPHE